MSNEKNSSLFTVLLANTKDVVTSILSYFFLAGNKFTVNIFLGLIISTTGAFMFGSKSICDNMLTKGTENDYKENNNNDNNDNTKNGENNQFQKVEIKLDNN